MASPLAQALAFQNSVQPAQTPIGPTDVLGAYKLASDVAEKNYQAKLQQMQAMWGGLASLGVAGILGYPALKKAFGSAATNAASGSGAAGSAAPAAAGSADAGAVSPVASSTPWTTPLDASVPGATSSSLIPDATAPALAGDYSIGSVAPSVAPSIAADYGLTGAGSMLGGDAAGAAGSIAADLGAGGAAAGLGADAAAATVPDWLAGFLAFL